jgi:hypothetical protein
MAKAALAEMGEESTRPSTLERLLNNKLLLVLISALITAFVVFNFFVSDSGSQRIETEKISGKIALSESELVDLANQINQPIFWLGPEENYFYALTIAENEQSYVKYLPREESSADSDTAYRIIATYLRQDAYNITQSAANNPGAVGLSNSDGATIYYNSLTPTNIYLAYPGQNFQIEIFDPVPGAALELALTPDLLTRIG